MPADGPDERYVYLSDVLPTAWQAVEYADIPDDAPRAYETFQKKEDGMIKVVLTP